LEKTGEVDLDGALGDHEGSGNLFILKALRKQAHELSFALGESHPAGAEEAVGEGLLEPELTGLDLLQTFDLQISGQRFAQNAPDAQTHGLERQLGGDRVYPQNDFAAHHRMLHIAQYGKRDFLRKVQQDQVGNSAPYLIHNSGYGTTDREKLEAFHLP